jgi:hypothetical protein
MYANSGKLHTVNIKRNIQTLRQTPGTQYASSFENLELIWTVDRSAYMTIEICIRINSVNLCVTKRKEQLPNEGYTPYRIDQWQS